MKKSIHLHNGQKKYAIVITVLSILITALLTASPTSAAVSNWDVSPEDPVIGDTLRIKGSASPEEELNVQVTFEKEVSVSGGEYEYILEGVKIPEGFDNSFTVQATGANDLNVRVKILIWVTKSAEASGNTATVSQSSVPPGTYNIKIDGNAKSGVSTVTLKITAVQQIEADSDGDFSYSYNTKAVPAGDFEISVGGIKKTVTIQEEETSAGTSGFSSQETESVTGDENSETSEENEDTGETEDAEDIENTGTDLNPEQIPEDENDEEVQPEPIEKTEQTVDTAYMFGGMGAAVLILIIYSKRK